MQRKSAYLAVSTTPEGLIEIEQPIGIGESERVHLRAEDVDTLCRWLLLAKHELGGRVLRLVDAWRCDVTGREG
jgi:hypothetical protein